MNPLTLLVFLFSFHMYIYNVYNNKVEEQMLMCNPLLILATNRLSCTWLKKATMLETMCWYCTDGALQKQQLMVLLHMLNHWIRMHYSNRIIGHQTLAVEKIPNALKTLSVVIVKAVNFIETKPIESKSIQCALWWKLYRFMWRFDVYHWDRN